MKKMRALSGALALSLMAMSAVPAAAQRYDRAEHHEPKKKSDKTGNTLLGVGLGLLGGAILSGGDPWASLAGAAAGGAIGNIASGDNRSKRQDDWRYRRDRDPRRDDRRYYHDRRYRDDRR